MTTARTRTVQNIIEKPDGRPVARRNISIQLNTVGFSDSGQRERVATCYATTDETGLWSAVLPVNDDIDPAGTFYTVREMSGVIWSFVVPVGDLSPVWLRSILVADPTNPYPLAAGVPLPDDAVPGGYVWVTDGGGTGGYEFAAARATVASVVTA